MRSVLVQLPDNEPMKVTFTGDYVTKRELSIILRAIKKEHINAIRMYRKRRIIEEYEKKKAEVKNGTVGQSDTDTRGSVAGATGKPGGSGTKTAAPRTTQPAGRSAANAVSANSDGNKSSAAAGRDEEKPNS